MNRVRIGLIVNPIAGMGGRVALKGTDGDALAAARALGATPLAPIRAVACLEAISAQRSLFELYTAPGPMGEEEARRAGFSPAVVGTAAQGGRDTTSEDSVVAAVAMRELGLDLILFAGGDGTARDILDGVGEGAKVLGIPAGVKIHSAVFASSPARAGALVSDFVEQERVRRVEKLAEVMDIDESAYRVGALKARLYGYLRIPYERGKVQNLKSGSAASEAGAQVAVADGAAEILSASPKALYLIGAGTTTRALLDRLGLKGTLLGVDAYLDGSIVGNDLSEAEILQLLDRGTDAKIVITPIGGQGFLFGRGNQQFSPEVIEKIGKGGIMVLSTPAKLHALNGEPLLIDTGETALDRELAGYYKITTGYRQFVIYKAVQG